MKKTIRTGWLGSLLTLLLALVFLAQATVQAETMQIQPKGSKKINIGVMDLISAIEVAAIYNAAYQKEAAARGWNVRVFDLQLQHAQAPTVMENMIVAGYDAIIVNWTSPHFFKDQVATAFKKGIPVITVAEGGTFPMVMAEVGQYYGVSGALSAQYLASKLKGAKGQKGKVVMFNDKRLELAKLKFASAQAIFSHFGIPVITEIDVGSSEGNPSVWSKEQMKNLILADKNKEIKGVWAYWEGAGLPAAEACADLGRADIVVVTCEDSPRTYEMIRSLPTLHATSGGNKLFLDSSVKRLFALLEEIFAGKPMEDQQLIEAVPYLVTKENLPPKGYFYNAARNYSGQPDFEVK